MEKEKLSIEKIQLFAAKFGIQEDIFLEENESSIEDIVSDRFKAVEESIKTNEAFRKEIENAHYGKVMGGLSNRLKKEFGFTDSDIKDLPYEEILKKGIESKINQGSQTEEELRNTLAELQGKLAPAVEENESLKSKLSELPALLENEFKTKLEINRFVRSAYDSLKGMSISFEQFDKLSKIEVLNGEGLTIKDGKLLRLKDGSPEYTTDHKIKDYAEELKTYAATFIPIQNVNGTGTPPPPETKGNGNIHPNALKAFENGGYVSPYVK